MTFLLLAVLGWPLLAGLGVLCLGRTEALAKRMALIGAAVAACLGMALAYGAFSGAALGGVDWSWLGSLNSRFTLGVHGLGLILVVLSAVLPFLIVLSSLSLPIATPRWFYALLFLMQAALVGVFSAGDALLFYIFWEMTLIPAYFLILLWGGARRVAQTLVFFIYTLSGSLLMLLALAYLYVQTPAPHTFSLAVITHLSLSSLEQWGVFVAFFMAFAIKTPLFPFHTWQPDTYETASPTTTMMLAGLMSKMGLYGMALFILPLCPEPLRYVGPLVVWLGIAGIVYASAMALVQTQFKRVLAYSSIAHLSLIVVALFSGTAAGYQGAGLQMVSHAVLTVGLFGVAQMIASRYGTTEMGRLGGLVRENRVFSAAFLVFVLGSIAFPFTSGFVGEFTLLWGIFQFSKMAALVAGSTLVLGAWYMLKAYQTMMLGEPQLASGKLAGLSVSERLLLWIVALLVLLMGLCPQPILKISGQFVFQPMEWMKPLC